MDNDPNQSSDRDFVHGNVRRIVGVSALRRIRNIVEERVEGERQKRRLAIWILVVLGALAVLGYVYARGTFP